MNDRFWLPNAVESAERLEAIARRPHSAARLGADDATKTPAQKLPPGQPPGSAARSPGRWLKSIPRACRALFVAYKSNLIRSSEGAAQQLNDW